MGADAVVVFFTMYGAMNAALVITHMFHNVNFAIVGPFQRCFGAQHPDSGPGTYSFWKPCTHFNFTILPLRFSFGNQAC